MPRLGACAAAGLLGLLLGWLCADIVLVDSGLALLPWALAGLSVGAAVTRRRLALLAGASYGFVLAFAFMAFSYDGTASLTSRIPFFAALGLVGAACGAVLALLGATVRARRNT